MLDVSQEAADVIAVTCRQRSAPEGGYRIRRRPEIAEADGLRVGFTRAPHPGDLVIHQGDAQVFVAPEALDLVEGWVLCVRRRNDRPELLLRRGRAAA